jgi:hypothetical protein
MGFLHDPRKGIFQGLYHWHELKSDRGLATMK